MSRLAIVTAAALIASSNAFTAAPQPSRRTLHAEPPKYTERGVSMDQDGKSNVWAIEPKMEIENKSSEEKTGGILAGVAALGVFAVIAAGVLTNLPDPNQF